MSMEATAALIEACQDDDTERALLGSLFVDSQWIYEIRDQVDRQSFWRSRHRKIWDAILELVEEEKPVDVVTVADCLDAQGELEGVGGPSYLTRLSNETPSAVHAPDYADILERHRRLRDLWSIGRRLQQVVTEYEADPDEITADAVAAIRDDSATSSRTRLTAEEIDDRWESTLKGDDEESDSWPTGIQGLDFMLGGGLVAGRNIFLAALPKHGKSSAAFAIAANLLKRHDFAVDIYGVEQSHEEIEARMVSWATGASASDALDVIREGGTWGDVDVDLRDKIERGRSEFRSWDLEVDVRGEHHVDDIALSAQARVAGLPEERAGRYLLIVDYLQAMTAGNRSSDRWGDLVDVSTTLRDVSKSLNVPVLSLLQFGSAAEDKFVEQGERPTFNDAWGSSQFQKDANHFVTLHRPYFGEGGEAERFCRLHQDLSRHGGNGRYAEVEADLERCRFASWRGPEPDVDTEELDERQSAAAGWEY